MIVDGASVPDVIFDGENIRVYYSNMTLSVLPNYWFQVAISGDGSSWEYRDIETELPEGMGGFDPDVVRLDNGSYRMYYYGAPITEGDPALYPGPHKIYFQTSDDGINFQGECLAYEGEWRYADPDVIQMGNVWRMFLSKPPKTISTISHDNGLSFSFERELPFDGSVTGTVAVPGGYRIYYHRGLPPRIYSAFSADGENWVEDAGVRLEAGGAGALDEGGVESPSVVRMPDNTYRMYYHSIYGTF